MATQKHYRNTPDGQQEIPLKEPLTFEELNILDRRKYNYRLIIYGLIGAVIIALILLASPAVQKISLGGGSGMGIIRLCLQFFKSRPT